MHLKKYISLLKKTLGISRFVIFNLENSTKKKLKPYKLHKKALEIHKQKVPSLKWEAGNTAPLGSDMHIFQRYFQTKEDRQFVKTFDHSHLFKGNENLCISNFSQTWNESCNIKKHTRQSYLQVSTFLKNVIWSKHHKP